MTKRLFIVCLIWCLLFLVFVPFVGSATIKQDSTTGLESVLRITSKLTNEEINTISRQNLKTLLIDIDATKKSSAKNLAQEVFNKRNGKVYLVGADITLQDLHNFMGFEFEPFGEKPEDEESNIYAVGVVLIKGVPYTSALLIHPDVDEETYDQALLDYLKYNDFVTTIKSDATVESLGTWDHMLGHTSLFTYPEGTVHRTFDLYRLVTFDPNSNFYYIDQEIEYRHNSNYYMTQAWIQDDYRPEGNNNFLQRFGPDSSSSSGTTSYTVTLSTSGEATVSWTRTFNHNIRTRITRTGSKAQNYIRWTLSPPSGYKLQNNLIFNPGTRAQVSKLQRYYNRTEHNVTYYFIDGYQYTNRTGHWVITHPVSH